MTASPGRKISELVSTGKPSVENMEALWWILQDATNGMPEEWRKRLWMYWHAWEDQFPRGIWHRWWHHWRVERQTPTQEEVLFRIGDPYQEDPPYWMQTQDDRYTPIME